MAGPKSAALAGSRGQPSATFDKGLTVRALLRNATADIHERMHAHPGFSAAAAGCISKRDYIRLLRRLLAFHRPYESFVEAAGQRFDTNVGLFERARSGCLVTDLKTLGVTQDEIDRLPSWSPPFRLESEAALLGSLYVLEGSSLGGLRIAQALGERFAVGGSDPRRFFLGRGTKAGPFWRDLIGRLEALSDNAARRSQALEASVATFEAFERWMADWIAQPVV